MKIAICAERKHEASPVSKRYARSNYYAVYDETTSQFTFIENEAKEESSGAGNKATKILGDLGVDVLLAPKAGPKAFDMLQAFDIEAYQYDPDATVKEALESYHEGRLPKIIHAEASGSHS